tara:strand:+ start:31 stop:486 length:456 start_codon:yes stop_codon:yes gene_type:complete
MNLKQFKLTNNDEIICEVVEDTDHGILIRKVLKVIATDDFERNVRYYAFRPWLSFQDDFDELSVLNIGHIIGETTPSNTIAVHFKGAMDDVEKAKKLKREFNIEDIINEMGDDWDDDMLEEFLEQKLREQNFTQDSADPKIIHFKPGKTRH